MNVHVVQSRLPREEFTGPPREWFLGEEWFARDMAAVFRPNWMLAGHVGEIEGAGTYITYAFLDEEVFIRKDADGEVRAYHNFCPHRGARLCQEKAGRMGPRVVCPYHSWSFSPTDGALLTAPAMHEGFDKIPWRLTAAHVEVWKGLIFVSFADAHPVTMAEQIGADRLGGYDFERVKIASVKTMIVEANWKIVAENNLECYHCLGNHPELCAVQDWQSWGAPPESFDAIIAEAVETESQVISLEKPGYLFTPGNTKVCQVPLPRNDDDADPPAFGMRFSNVEDIVMVRDYAGMFLAKPLGPSRTEIRIYWFVSRDAVEGRDYRIEDIQAFLGTVFEQDGGICENVQKGMQMPRYVAGPLNRAHQVGQAAFYAWYMNRIARHFPQASPGRRGA